MIGPVFVLLYATGCAGAGAVIGYLLGRRAERRDRARLHLPRGLR